MRRRSQGGEQQRAACRRSQPGPQGGRPAGFRGRELQGQPFVGAECRCLVGTRNGSKGRPAATGPAGGDDPARHGARPWRRRPAGLPVFVCV